MEQKYCNASFHTTLTGVRRSEEIDNLEKLKKNALGHFQRLLIIFGDVGLVGVTGEMRML